MYFDAHTHLNSPDLYTDRNIHLTEFINIWWIWLVNIGMNQSANINGIQICKSLHPNDTSPTIGNTDKSGRYAKLAYDKNGIPRQRNTSSPQIYCTIWLHPCEVLSWDITDTNMHFKIKEMCMLYAPYKEFIVGIGECGIDTHESWSESSLSIQQDLFTQQCDLARQWSLPIIIHSRSNRSATHHVLQNFTDLTIYFHCRSYTVNEIKTIQKTYPDFYIGFAWNITYPKAVDIRKSLRYLSHGDENYPEYITSWKINQDKANSTTRSISSLNLSNILIETDAPYLPPQSQRGKQNWPAMIVETYDYISWLLQRNINEQVINNAKKCYNI
jgi:TatD DNase family protein